MWNAAFYSTNHLSCRGMACAIWQTVICCRFSYLKTTKSLVFHTELDQHPLNLLYFLQALYNYNKWFWQQFSPEKWEVCLVKASSSKISIELSPFLVRKQKKIKAKLLECLEVRSPKGWDTMASKRKINWEEKLQVLVRVDWHKAKLKLTCSAANTVHSVSGPVFL